MPEITKLSTITTDPATYDDILALRARIDVALFNLTMGNGTFGGVDYEENGNTGFRIQTSTMVKNLLAWREQLTKDLMNPALLGEIVYELTVVEGEVARQVAQLNQPYVNVVVPG